MRTDAGPRDWTPGGGTPGNYVPFASDKTPPRNPLPWSDRPQHNIHPIRNIGLLAAFTGATALFAELALLIRTDVDFWPHLALAPLSIILSVIGLAVLRSLGLANRVGAVIGLALGTVAALLLAASLTGFVDTSRLVADPLPPSPNELLAESTQLTTAADALVAALAASGALPIELLVDNGVASTPAGPVELPEGARLAYSADGVSYELILTGQLGTVASYNSLQGFVLASEFDS